ncbi:MAG: flap endonuclease-1 [Thermoprotei archaeon]|nr:flap endonuclease-1 [Thermoprotei archaeon]
MGVDLRELIPGAARREVDVSALKGEAIALDAYNMLYQFLAAIRQPDGTPLMDREGRITSHLSGLFYRTISLVEGGVRPVYIFDGKPPEMKAREIEERARRREEAELKYRAALEMGLREEARKYAQATGRLTSDMVLEAKELLEAMGIPWVQAAAEGEAQAAYLSARGDTYAAGSQDYDSLLFGSKRLVRNLAITGKRKVPGRDEYVEVKPEIIELDKLLKALDITREQLIAIGVIVGTDYNPGGVKGYGVQKALKHVKTLRDPIKALTAIPKAEWAGADPVKIYEYFLNPPVNKEYKIVYREPNAEAVKEILVSRHDFSPDRVEKGVERLVKAYKEHIKARQKRLDAWFG